MTKPQTKYGYSPEATERVRRTALSVATRLGDLLDEDVVIIGGLVPSLLIDMEGLPDNMEPHVGTTDLDLGLAIALRDEARYHELRDRLMGADFAPARNEKNNEQRQTWVSKDGAMVDFFIPQGEGTPGPGRLQNLRGDFAAVVTPGLHLAFRQVVRVRLAGRTLDGATVSREVPVCGPGAFCVLKALAHKNRGEPKDAYDLYFLSRFFGAGPGEVGALLGELRDDDCAIEAIECVRENFAEHDQLGPRHVATFLTGDLDDDIQADVVGIASALLSACAAS